MAARTDDSPIRFAEKLMVLLDQGARTATYKFAVLVALMDLALEQSSRRGDAPDFVTTRQLAERVLELYWPQVRPFGPTEGARELRQNTGGQAKILSAIRRFREKLPGGVLGSPSVHRAALAAPKAYARLLREVEWSLVHMPLPRLQRFGRAEDRFIYAIGWDDGLTKSAFNSADFDNRVHFVGRAGDHLATLSGLLRPIIHRQWAAMVARLNDLPEAELEAFMFGRARTALTPLVEPLRELQSGRCFYCEGRISAKAHVDHFFPWSRHPDDGLDNLVLAHERCNLHKSDFLPAAEHLQRWSEHLRAHDDDLAELARTQHWARDRPRTVGVVRGVYGRLPHDARLWRAKGEFVPLEAERVREALRGLH